MAPGLLKRHKALRLGHDGVQVDDVLRVLVEEEDGTFAARSVTELKVGERLRLRRTEQGTHVGRTISARVEEL